MLYPFMPRKILPLFALGILFANACQAPLQVPQAPSPLPTPSGPISTTPAVPSPELTSCLTVGYDQGDYFQIQQFHISCQMSQQIEKPLTGFILDRERLNKLGLADVQLTLTRLDADSPGGSSDAEGAFRLDFQGPGSYRLQIVKPGYRAQERTMKYFHSYQAALDTRLKDQLVIQLER